MMSMKAILMSDRPKWCALMMSRKKKVEVRKGAALYKAIQKLIDEYGYADIYVYCSKINRKHYHLIESIDTDTGKTDYEIDYYIGSEDYLDWCFDGKVAFKFRCYNVEEIKYDAFFDFYETKSSIEYEIRIESCLNREELHHYLKTKTSTAIHISDLEIFDKPKELREFKIKDFERIKVMGSPYGDLLGSVAYHYEKKPILRPLTKAPQSYMFIEIGE